MALFFFLQHSVKYVELAAAITGFLYWYKLRGTRFQWFPVYLSVIAGCEFLGYYLKQQGIPGNRELYAWFVIPLEFLFFHWLYYGHFGKRGKWVVVFCTLGYLMAWLAENILVGKINSFFLSLSYSVGNITLLILSILYFLRLMKSDRIVFFYREIFFWINSGLVLFYLGTFPYFGLFNYLAREQYSLFLTLAWGTVILNLIMYSLFITAFICGKRK